MSQLQSQTNVEPVDNAIRYRMADMRLADSTDVERKLRRDSLLLPAQVGITRDDSVLSGDLRTQVVKTVHEEAATQRRTSIAGAILQFDPVSVKCELYLERGPITVQLPREMFPEGISYGTSVLLELVDDRGFRKPKISLRQPAKTEEQIRIEQEIDQLIAGL